MNINKTVTILHPDPEAVLESLEQEIKSGFWESKKQYFETMGEKTPEDFKKINIHIMIEVK